MTYNLFTHVDLVRALQAEKQQETDIVRMVLASQAAKPAKSNKPLLLSLAVVIITALLSMTRPAAASGQSGHYTQMVWANAPAQQIDLDGDNDYEHFAANVSIFADGSASGTIELGDAYFVRCDRGTTTPSAGTATINGSLYRISHPATALSDDIVITLQRPHGGGDDDDLDFPDTIIWDLDGGGVQHTSFSITDKFESKGQLLFHTD